MGKKRDEEQAMYPPAAHGFACVMFSRRFARLCKATGMAPRTVRWWKWRYRSDACCKATGHGIPDRPLMALRGGLCETGCSGKGVHIEWSESVLSSAIWQNG